MAYCGASKDDWGSTVQTKDWQSSNLPPLYFIWFMYSYLFLYMFVILYVFAFFPPNIYIISNKYIYIIPSSEYIASMTDNDRNPKSWKDPILNQEPLRRAFHISGGRDSVCRDSWRVLPFCLFWGGILNYWFINQFWGFPHKIWI